MGRFAGSQFLMRAESAVLKHWIREFFPSPVGRPEGVFWVVSLTPGERDR